MRGEGELDLGNSTHTGITPAHAGRRPADKSHRTGRWDHPRACGEKVRTVEMNGEPWGSPPRMRGEEATKTKSKKWRRITPAHAGRSFCTHELRSAQKDHPRACGEKPAPLPALLPPQGSPPRMRGEACLACLRGHVVRITPAHAGRSSAKRAFLQLIQDHPRACGEKAKAKALRHLLRGSPPRMRGEVLGTSFLYAVVRITPAHAGRRGKNGAVGISQ